MKKMIPILIPVSFLTACQMLPEADTLVTCTKSCDELLTLQCRPDGSSDPFSDQCKKEKEEQLTCEDSCR